MYVTIQEKLIYDNYFSTYPYSLPLAMHSVVRLQSLKLCMRRMLLNFNTFIILFTKQNILILFLTYLMNNPLMSANFSPKLADKGHSTTILNRFLRYYVGDSAYRKTLLQSLTKLQLDSSHSLWISRHLTSP